MAVRGIKNIPGAIAKIFLLVSDQNKRIKHLNDHILRNFADIGRLEEKVRILEKTVSKLRAQEVQREKRKEKARQP